MLAGLAAGLGGLLTANPCGAVDQACRLSGLSWPGGLAGDRASRIARLPASVFAHSHPKDPHFPLATFTLKLGAPQAGHLKL